MNVAVKVLKEGASREIREDFKREVEITSAFDHPNILKLIGVVAIGKEAYQLLILILSFIHLKFYRYGLLDIYDPVRWMMFIPDFPQI